jgi:hypothetical protein
VLTPVTTPVDDTVTRPVTVLQVPPVVVEVSVAGVPVQIVVGPPIVPAVATAFTVTGYVAVEVPQLLVTA